MNRLEAFDIRNFSLNILKEESSQLVCECPVCGGHRLTVSKETGAYQCWSGECAVALIREAIAPLPNQNGTPRRQTPKTKPVQKPKSPAPLPERINLARLPQPATDCPQPQKRFDKQHGEVEETIYYYTPDKWKTRTQWRDDTKPKGHDKTFVLWHRDSSGKAIAKAGEGIRPPYRIDEAIAVAKACGASAVMGAEGENSVELYRQSGLACTTLSSFSKAEIALLARMLKDAGLGLVYLPDHDQAGQNKAAKIQEAFASAGVPFLDLDPVAICPSLPESGDVVEILAVMDTPEFIKQLEEEIHRAVESRQQAEREENSESVDIPDSLDPDTEFTQRALSFLYGDKPWICADDKLYFWTGIYYKESPDAVQRPMIASFCNSYPVQQKDGSIRYPYAKPSKVREALQWVKDRLEVDPTLLNPPGLNCTNGVLQISWAGSIPSWHLVDHDPAMYYTYEPVITHDPDANPEHCERLLEVLDKPQQQVFLRSIAASLDLATVRIHKGRLVRSLLLKGHGANGKDSLREVVAAMYGYRGITSASLTDFASYDQGRKFPLARLAHSRINWSSENANFDKLDKIQSLKAFITGDPISVEAKGKDEHEFTPVGIGLFNVNDTPNLQASSEAIQSRYGVLTFNKTFKIGADPALGELEADPRFKYDPAFLRSKVLPAFLNKVLAALVDLMAEGIDYRCTEQALQDIQSENSHLFQFAQDTGLGYNPNSLTTAGEIWEKLEQWYLDNGTLIYDEGTSGKKKSQWVDQARKGDANVKGPNQVIARFQNLFPKTKRVTVGKGKVALSGITFNFSPNGEAVEVDCGAVVSQLVSQSPLPDKDGEPVTPVSLSHVEIELSAQGFEQCDQSEAQKEGRGEKLTQLAHPSDTARDTASPTAPPTGSLNPQLPHPEEQPFKVGDKVAHSDPYTVAHNYHGIVDEVAGDKISVRWAERLGLANECETYSCAELRRLE